MQRRRRRTLRHRNGAKAPAHSVSPKLNHSHNQGRRTFSTPKRGNDKNIAVISPCFLVGWRLASNLEQLEWNPTADLPATAQAIPGSDRYDRISRSTLVRERLQGFSAPKAKNETLSQAAVRLVTQSHLSPPRAASAPVNLKHPAR